MMYMSIVVAVLIIGVGWFMTMKNVLPDLSLFGVQARSTFEEVTGTLRDFSQPTINEATQRIEEIKQQYKQTTEAVQEEIQAKAQEQEAQVPEEQSINQEITE